MAGIAMTVLDLLFVLSQLLLHVIRRQIDGGQQIFGLAGCDKFVFFGRYLQIDHRVHLDAPR